MKKLKYTFKIIKEAGGFFTEKDVFTHAAALAYYTVFSLAPMLVIIIFSTSRVYDENQVRNFLFNELGGLIGKQGANNLALTIDNVADIEPTLWSTILGVGLLIFSSTTVFITMQNALNNIFDVKTKAKGLGILKMIRDRVLSFTLLLGLTFILIISLSVNALISAFIEKLEAWMGMISSIVAVSIALFLPLLIISILFAMIFKFLPDVKLSWRETIFGAISTAILFSIGKELIGIYIGQINLGDVYNTAGSIMILMVWIFYASVIFLFGACITKAHVIDSSGGDYVQPEDYAVKTEKREIELD